MKKTSKIIITAISIIVFFLVSILLGALAQANGRSSTGLLGIVLLLGLVGALKAIWKKDKNPSNSNEIDKSE